MGYPPFTVTERVRAMLHLTDGAYIAQNVGSAAIYYVSHGTIPGPSIGWLRCDPGDWIVFDIGPGEKPVFVQCQTGETSVFSVANRGDE